MVSEGETGECGAASECSLSLVFDAFDPDGDRTLKLTTAFFKICGKIPFLTLFSSAAV